MQNSGSDLSMPAKPLWTTRYHEIQQELATCGAALLDRHALEQLLSVRKRRAQQILSACAERTLGNSAAVTPHRLAEYLRCVYEDGELEWEQRRRRRMASFLNKAEKSRTEQPQLLVEAPTSITGQRLESLPPGVELGPGWLKVQFRTSEEGLEKLLALAMAIANDLEEFRTLTASDRR
jgi:hypothetical protein